MTRIGGDSHYFSTIEVLVETTVAKQAASPTFGHVNANFSVFIDRIRNQFLKILK